MKSCGPVLHGQSPWHPAVGNGFHEEQRVLTRMALSAVSGWRRGGWGVGHDEFVRHILDRYTRPSLATRWFVIECPRMCARSVCADRRERSGGVR